ncbi:hypothetical protein I5R16_04600 [Serratia marcescens]|uniref:hypothetical protein n=1 Tax=Serratia marcescens TaxID=615 RepID=UPI0009A4949D|nr:hypothetical protein [Serratia marcescens]MBH3126140.1 hypothetical protein [Serratia marcescens]OPK00332.1 hypothetical protein B1R44_03940 [Serratia marcescens]
MADNNYWLAKIRAQVCPEHSEAADFWNGLSPEWRGVTMYKLNKQESQHQEAPTRPARAFLMF